MKVKVGKTPLNKGQVRVISSKSDAHRSLIAAALAEEESVLDIKVEATCEEDGNKVRKCTVCGWLV